MTRTMVGSLPSGFARNGARRRVIGSGNLDALLETDHLAFVLRYTAVGSLEFEKFKPPLTFSTSLSAVFDGPRSPGYQGYPKLPYLDAVASQTTAALGSFPPRETP